MTEFLLIEKEERHWKLPYGQGLGMPGPMGTFGRLMGWTGEVPGAKQTGGELRLTEL